MRSRGPWQSGGMILLALALMAGSPALDQPGATVSARVASGPAIGPIALLTPEPIERYGRFEIAFDVRDTVATNLYYPYDPATPPGVVGTGISVDVLLLPPNERDWAKAITSPCFFYQPVEEAGSGTGATLLPVGEPEWRCRFTPTVTGSWQYRVRAADASGTALSPTQGLECTESERKGFVRVSSTDPTFFEFSDGTPFVTPLINVEDGGPLNGLADLRRNLETLGTHGVRFVRWFPTGEGANYAIIPFGDDIRSSWGFGPARTGPWDVDVEAGKRLSFVPYYYTHQSIPAVPGARYRLTLRALVTGDKVFRPQITHGITPLAELTICANAGRCDHPSEGWKEYTLEVINPSDVGVLTVFLRDGYAEDEDASGKIRLSSIHLQRDESGHGDWGPDLLSRSDPETHTYIDPRSAALLDEVFRLSEQYGVYHKLTLFHKNDEVLNRIMPDGSFSNEWDANNRPFYSAEGKAGRWYQEAYERYFVARWSYSPALHSLELANENHLSPESFDAGFAAAEFIHAFAPRHILMSNSFWGRLVDAFWSDPDRGDLLDYADMHWYANEASTDGDLIGDITDDSAANVRACWSRLRTYATQYDYSRPMLRGETGVAVSGTAPLHPDIRLDTRGAYYHKQLWAHVGSLGYQCGGEWYTRLLDANGLWGVFAAFERFMEAEPVSNGRYEAIGNDLDGDARILTSLDGGGSLRAWGVRDAGRGRVLLWIDNVDDTWRHAVDGILLVPVRGTLTLQGLPVGLYRLEWWDTSAGTPTASWLGVSSREGELMLAVEDLRTDRALKISPAICLPFNRLVF